MKIAWFNRYAGNAEEEKKYLEHGIEHYGKVYYNSDNAFPEENVLYMLGELNYRVHDYDKARDWFGKLMAMDKSNPMVKKGSERWFDIKTIDRHHLYGITGRYSVRLREFVQLQFA